MNWRNLRIALITDPLAAVCVVGMGVTSSLASMVDRDGDLAHRVVSWWARRLLFAAGVKVDAAGKDRVPKESGLVFVSNHRSMMDIPVLMAHLPASFRFLAKRSLFRTPFIGWHLSLGGHIGIEREDKRSAAKGLAQARRLLGNGGSVLLFAEGSRSRVDLDSFKGGAAHLAIKSGATVVPVGLVGTRNALPRGSFHIRPEPVRLRIGDPISTDGMTSRDHDRLTQTLYARVRDLIAEPAPGDR